MRKVTIFTGTRAEYGLLYPLMKSVNSDPELVLQIIASGMHLSPEFGNTYSQIEQDGFEINEKVEMLLSSNTSVGVAKSVGLGVIGFVDALQRLKPDILVLLGDRFELLSIAQAALFLRIPILHIHGGELTEGAYDDVIRHAISKFSHMHCTSTDTYRQRVIQLGESPDRVKNVGAIGLDNLKELNLLSVDKLSESLSFSLSKHFFLVTYHPVTQGGEDPEKAFQLLLNALDEFPQYRVVITYPNADDGGRKIINMIERYASNRSENVLAIPSLGQLRYLSALKNAAVVIGNSSSGIIEAPSFGIPTVNIGIRQKGRLSAPSVIHSSVNEEELILAIKKSISLEHIKLSKEADNPYGDGDTTPKILHLLKTMCMKTEKVFYDLKVNDLNG